MTFADTRDLLTAEETARLVNAAIAADGFNWWMTVVHPRRLHDRFTSAHREAGRALEATVDIEGDFCRCTYKSQMAAPMQCACTRGERCTWAHDSITPFPWDGDATPTPESEQNARMFGRIFLGK